MEGDIFFFLYLSGNSRKDSWFQLKRSQFFGVLSCFPCVDLFVSHRFPISATYVFYFVYSITAKEKSALVWNGVAAFSMTAWLFGALGGFSNTH